MGHKYFIMMNSKIATLNLSKLNSSQSLEHLMDTVSKALNDEKVSAKLTSGLSIMQAATDEFDVQYRQLIASHLTKEVEEARIRFRNCYRAMRDIFNAAVTYSATDAAGKSAHKIHLLMETYSINPRMNQTELTNQVYNLLNDLSSDQYAADVKAVNAEMAVKALLHEYEVFKALIQKRTQGRPGKGSYHLDESRERAEKAYRTFINQVNVVAELDQTADFNAFIESMNKDIQYYRQTVIASNKRARTIAKKQKEDLPTPGEQDAAATDGQTEASEDNVNHQTEMAVNE